MWRYLWDRPYGSLTLWLLCLVTELAQAAPPALPPVPSTIDKATLAAAVTFFSVSGAMFRWHYHRSANNRAPYNNVARYLDKDGNQREKVLRAIAATDWSKEKTPPALDKDTEGILNTASIRGAPLHAFLAAMGRWQVAFDELLAAGRLLDKIQDGRNKMIKAIRLAIMDVTRPDEDATDDQIIDAFTQYSEHIQEIALSGELRVSQSPSGKTMKAILAEWRTEIARALGAPPELVEKFDLYQLRDSITTELSKWANLFKPGTSEGWTTLRRLYTEEIKLLITKLGRKEKGDADCLTNLRRYVLLTTNTNIRIWELVQEEGAYSHNIDLDQKIKGYLNDISKWAGTEFATLEEASEHSPEPTSTKGIAEAWQVINSTDKNTAEEMATTIRELIKPVNASLFNGLQERAPTLETLMQSCKQVNDALADIISRLGTTELSWAAMRSELLFTFETGFYLSSEAQIRIRDQHSGKLIHDKIYKNGFTAGYKEGLTSKPTAKASDATEDPLFWAKLGTDVGLSQELVGNIRSRKTFREVLTKALQAELGIEDFELRGGVGEDASISELLASLGTKNSWSCEDKCPVPQYNGNCTTLLLWKEEARTALDPIWDKSDAGYRDKAIYHFKKALCETAAGWARYADLESAANKSSNTTFGETFFALVNLLEEENGIDPSERRREAKRKFFCDEIKANCWSEFWQKFVYLAGEAGMKEELQSGDSEVIRDRLLTAIPDTHLRRCKMIALNRSTNLGALEKVDDWSITDIRNVLAETWKKEQKDPHLPRCDNQECASGLPKKSCPCKKPMQASAENLRKGCENHRSLTPEQQRVVNNILKDLSKVRISPNEQSARFKACITMGICSWCLGKFNQQTFETWWNNNGRELA